MTKSSVNVVVAGGGTAGHIEPALAVASVLENRGNNVIALGTPKGLETTLVPARGFELKLINPVPVPRKIGADLLKLPFRLVKTVYQTRKILKQHNTDVLIGFGGYVAAPGYIAAKLAGIPFIVHEANARAGMANKLGVKLGGTGLNAVANSGMEGEIVMGGRVEAITVTGMVMLTGSVEPSWTWTTIEPVEPTGVPLGTETLSSCPETLACTGPSVLTRE